MTTAPRLRVLALAEQCHPDWPSLPVVGFKYARALSRLVDLVVVTQVRNRPALERDGLGEAQIVYLDTEAVARPMHRLATWLRGGQGLGWTIQMALDYPGYVAFEWAAWRRTAEHLRRGRFDLVHRLTPMSPTLPSVMAGKSPVPFVLGPLNGNLPWPAAFHGERRREREWLSSLRGLSRGLPYHRSTFRSAAAVLAAFDHTIADLPASVRPRVVNFPEVGIDPELFRPGRRTLAQPMTLLYAGRLVPYKLPDVIVRAVAASPLLQRQRTVLLGDGPEREALAALIAEHRLGHCVELRGAVDQAGVGEAMRAADVFVFPSIRELGAGVLVEAMASGLACVAVDYGGPAALLGPERGVSIPLGDRNHLVGAFRRELEALVRDPARVTSLGRAAHEHALTRYAWDRKAAFTERVYRWVLGQGARPDFWGPGTAALSTGEPAARERARRPAAEVADDEGGGASGEADTRGQGGAPDAAP